MQMSPGALVSFMLYQQSLSNAFSMMGDVFSALTAAVGAADKVRSPVHKTWMSVKHTQGAKLGSVLYHSLLAGRVWGFQTTLRARTCA